MNPTLLRRRLLEWYAAHKRRLPWRETSDPYAIWVSEVMLQQTRVDTVISYYSRFMERFATVEQLAKADLQTVLKLWEGLGYYSRARNLHRAAGQVVTQFDSIVPDTPKEFQSLPGVGDYICAAVLSIAFGRVLPVVDGNVKRVLARLLEIDTPVNRGSAHKQFLKPAQNLISPRHPADFNQALMELGALVCRPKKPDCGHCPLADLCLAKNSGTIDQFPKREAKRKTPHRHLAIGVVIKKGKLLVVQRPLDGLLGGLWEFPALPAGKHPAAERKFEKAFQDETGLDVAVERRLARIRHAYTHFTITGDVYLCRYAGGRVRLKSAIDHRWTSLHMLSRLPLHKANHKFMDALKEALKNI
jgi:A/G-specific adenine glycosylase